MARLVLSAYNAKCERGFVQVALLIGREPPFPTKTVEIRNVADCSKALEEYKAEAQATGKPLAISMTVARGERKPAGFDKLKAGQSFVTVNL